MVSFWPWKAADASPESFEKALSALSTKIINTKAKLDRTRATSRRVRVLCTLYLGFGYLVYAIVLALVVGYRNMGAVEWSGIAGGPVLICAARAVVAAYYNFRIEALSSKLKEHQTQRGDTIQKLKDATKYDSTLQLLEKYGGSEAKSGNGKGSEGNDAQGAKGSNKGSPGESGRAAGADGVASTLTPRRMRLPPPTANIQRDNAQTPASRQGTPPASKAGSQSKAANLDVSAEFAPNAYGANEDGSSLPRRIPSGQYVSGLAVTNSNTQVSESHWYDRILDLLMGDDETAARNRVVLICTSCRLVNGQAPPGTRSLTEVGSWRCMGCGAMNGEVAEAKKIMSEVLGKGARPSTASDDGSDGGNSVVVHVKEEEVGSSEDGPVAMGKDTGDSNNGARQRGKKAK